MSDRSGLKRSYDSAYDRAGPLFGLRPDPALVDLIAERSLSGRALDVGAGDGRHALFLARRGFTVDALDISERAVQTLRELARRSRLPVAPRMGDCTDPSVVHGPYSIIVADTVLGHLDRAEAAEVGKRLSGALAPGGLLFVIALADDDPRESEFADLSWTYYSPEQLVALFPHLCIERCERLSVTDRGHGEPHRHSVLRLVARRED
ncbi:MAG: class I SAM-dependent methyltransferase [candidate division WS1 bacterium]|jgi:SAM-dependent methyltransferase|nr:class I SAM-dependent methyltransferase [candidate division WS1 bacterium]